MNMSIPKYDLIIVGGGAAGLMAACRLERKLSVLLLEKEDTLGKKLTATGNGRCNLSNREMESIYFHGQNVWFTDLILQRFGVDEVLSVFREMGLFLREEDGRVYPYSMQARSVREALVKRVALSSVEVRTGAKVVGVEKSAGLRLGDLTLSGGQSFVVTLADGSACASESILICAGGMATPKLGSDGSGYALFENFGHTLITPRPALVQLICRPARKRLAGTRVRGKITVRPSTRQRQLSERSYLGEILFTDYGLSGIPVLNISGLVGRCLKESKSVPVELDLLPEMEINQLTDYLTQRRDVLPELPADDWGSGFLSAAVSQTIINEVLGAKRGRSLTLRRLSDKELHRLALAAKSWTMEVVDTKGFPFAQVTAGGLDTAEFNPRTLESVHMPGLFAAGEILDIDGDCGGYNLHWAWASALAASEGIIRHYDRD